MLDLRDVSAGYGGRAVIHGIDLEVHAGEIVALVGANGAGKSTLAKTISGVLPMLNGTQRLEGHAITDASPADRVRRGLVHVPEGRQIFAGLTVAENLELGGYVRRGDKTSHDSAFTRDAIFERFPVLRQRASSVAGNLSGGQQQMLAIGRALMAQPRLLILDEPSLGLSPLLVQEIFHLVAGLRQQGLAILLSEQNALMALGIADRGYVIENGRVSLSGPARDLANSPEVASRYLGLEGGEVSSRDDAGLYGRLTDIIRRRSVA
jgi:branched-chain amino acid transport system ATP-binding protein